MEQNKEGKNDKKVNEENVNNLKSRLLLQLTNSITKTMLKKNESGTESKYLGIISSSNIGVL